MRPAWHGWTLVLRRFVAANGHALGSPPLAVPLPDPGSGREYRDLATGRVVVGSSVDVAARNATVLVVVEQGATAT